MMSMIRYEFLLAWRNKFVHVTLGLAVLFTLLIRFVIPADFATPGALYVTGDAPEHPGVTKVESAQALRAKLEEETSARGVLLSQGERTLLVRGHETARERRLLTTTAAALTGAPAARTPKITTLRPPSPPTPFNLRMLPMMLAMDVVLLGYMFASAMLLLQKTTGTIKAYRTSPATTAAFLSAKLTVNLVLAAAYGLTLLFATSPGTYPLLPFLALLLLTTTAFTLLGLGTAVYFDNISGMFFPLIITGVTLAIPMGSVFAPTLSHPIVEWIPTYSVIATFHEMLFPTGKAGYLMPALLEIGAWALGCGVFAYVSMERKLMKEVA